MAALPSRRMRLPEMPAFTTAAVRDGIAEGDEDLGRSTGLDLDADEHEPRIAAHDPVEGSGSTLVAWSEEGVAQRRTVGRIQVGGGCEVETDRQCLERAGSEV